MRMTAYASRRNEKEKEKEENRSPLIVNVSKQYLYNLTWVENVLGQLLLRDFYKKENDYFFVTVAGNATGSVAFGSPTPANDAEELLRVISNARNKNFNPAYAIVDWTQWQRFLTIKPNDYSLPFGFFVTADGTMTCAGVRIVPTSWAASDHALLVDPFYLQRIEVESLLVELSYENGTNFEKNLVTFRVEALEEINRLRDDSQFYVDFRNS
jgi:hypothetical protein